MHLDLLETIGARDLPDLGFSSRTPAETFHVAPSGDDSAVGSRARPWKTIRKAATSLEAGQRALVHGGTYREADLNTANAGEPTAPIWLMEAPGEVAVIEGSPTSTRPFFVIDQPYWILDGFEINARGQQGHAVRINAAHVLVRNIHAHHGTGPAAVVFSGASDAALLNSEVHDYTWGNNDSHGVAVISHSARILIQRNHSYGNSGDSVQCEDTTGDSPPGDIWILQNRYHQDRENAVDLKRCVNVTVRGNKFFGYRPSPVPADISNQSPQGAAMVLHQGSAGILLEHNRIWDCGMGASMGAGPGMGDIVFRRNLVFDMKSVSVTRIDGTTVTSPGHGLRAARARTVEIYHNTFYDVAGYGIGLGDSGRLDRCVVVNNIVMDARITIDRRTSTTPGLISDWNLLWNTPPRSVQLRVDGTTRTLAQWQSSGLDLHSLDRDPLFVSDPRYNDFFTQSGSPARDAAHPVDDTAFCGAGPDVGFLETCP